MNDNLLDNLYSNNPAYRQQRFNRDLGGQTQAARVQASQPQTSSPNQANSSEQVGELVDLIQTTNNKEDPTEFVEYTYKKGDTFGQVIKDLGLNTDKGLWGNDGDVAYYTQQLMDQGMLGSNGNIPIGTKIKLRKRGAKGTPPTAIA